VTHLRMRTVRSAVRDGIAALACTGAAATALAGCSDSPTGTDPNAGLLRDFIDGKFDSAGHPLNASVLEAEATCAGDVADGAVRLPGQCSIPLHAHQLGEMIASARVRVAAHADAGNVLAVGLVGSDGTTLASDSLTVDRLRDADWFDLPLAWS